MEEGDQNDAKAAILGFFREIHQNSVQTLQTARATFAVVQRTELMVNELGTRLFGTKADPRPQSGIADLVRAAGMTAKQWKSIQRGIKEILG